MHISFQNRTTTPFLVNFEIKIINYNNGNLFLFMNILLFKGHLKWSSIILKSGNKTLKLVISISIVIMCYTMFFVEH